VSAEATAVLAAAGSGERLGAGGPKAVAELAGRPMLEWSLDALGAAESVGPLVVVLPPGIELELPDGAVPIAGGETRAESVGAGVAMVETELVVVHDAARPLITPALVDAVLEKLRSRPDASAVIAATALSDTVKRAREPRPAKGEIGRGGPTVARTESRQHLWAAQTPQAFRAAALLEAYETADRERIAAATDEAMLIEKAGGKVLIHPSPAENLKVTTPFEFAVAEMLLAQRAGSR
jgi:2-C-methyl-D-erythritol 4-phosphate cytidylyltransferase